MIVSSGVGVFTLTQPRGKRNFKAVQRAVPDSSIVSETPRQVPHFCISKHIAKPFIYCDYPKYTMGTVPLKSLQEFSHVEGAALFNAPIELIPASLKQPIPTRTEIDYDALTAEFQVPFQRELEYGKGIRPSVRSLKGEEVQEPDDPFPTRLAHHTTRDKERYGSYKLGTQEIALIGY